MNHDLSRALKLRKQGKRKESLKLLLALAKSHPRDPKISYQCAWAHDILGLERRALPYYRRAIRQGLSGKDLEGAFLGLGSSYRCVGEYSNAAKTLRRGADKFPSNRALRVFLAMALFNLGRHREAMEILLVNLAETSKDRSIVGYKKAISFYSGRL